MADPIYGIHQSQPRDVFAYTKQNARRIGLDADLYMLSNYPGFAGPGTTQIVFDDEQRFLTEELMDNRLRRYSQVTIYVVAIAPRGFGGVTQSITDELSRLGYTQSQTTEAYADRASFAAALGRDTNEVPEISGAAKVEVLAGVPTYGGPEGGIVDAPGDGQQYVRTGDGWDAIDLSEYETIQGSQDKIDAALGSTFNSRNVLLTSDTALFADGEAATVDPVGGNGWYYSNTTGNKINWYFYNGGSDTETIGSLQSADGGYYMLVDTRNNTSWPYLTVYTPRQNDGNDTSWYRSRLVYSPGGNYANQLSLGLHVLHTPNLKQSVKDDLAVKNPGVIFTQLELDPISTVGPQQTTEKLWLAAVSTSSNEPAGQETFVLKENAFFFNNKARSWQFAAIPTQQPEYTNYYKGAYATEAEYPESGALGQWIINSTDDTMLVWDVEGGDWKATGSTAAAPESSFQDYPFQYTYSSIDGSGYGFTNAYPPSNWSNTPDGKIQTTGYDSNFLSRRIKFGTLKNPGDEVAIRCSNNTTAFNRYAIIALTAGTVADDLSWKVAAQPSSGTAWMFSDSADRSKVEFYSAFINPYWGGTSYGHNLVGRSNSTGLIDSSLNQGTQKILFKVMPNYRIRMFIHGVYHCETSIVPSGGVDLYWVSPGETGRIINQPTGNGENYIASVAAASVGARYFMSTVGAPAGSDVLADNGTNFLYVNTQAGDPSDVELTAEEGNAARFSRVFRASEYPSMTLQERADDTYPIVKQDEKVLMNVEFLARGYFHSLDLTVEEIQAKMALYQTALAAAKAGSVEVCLGALLALTVPTSAGGEAIDIDPFYSGYNAGGTSDTRFNIPTSSQTRADYGITACRFWGQGTSLGQMEFYFDSNNQPNAALEWASQVRTVTFDVPGSDPGFEGTFTLDPSEVVYQSGSQVTYSNPGGWNHVEVEALAQWATSNGLQSGLATITFEAPAPTSPALALGEEAVVAELVAVLQLHLQKFPR